MYMLTSRTNFGMHMDSVYTDQTAPRARSDLGLLEEQSDLHICIQVSVSVCR